MQKKHITRRHFLCKSAYGLGAFSLSSLFLPLACRLRSHRQPNIIFILVDDMGWKGLSSYGNPHVETPCIDQLAKQGMKFTEAYAAPMCSPTRAALLSGQYPARLQITRALPGRDIKERAAWKILQTPTPQPMLPFEQHTMAEALKDCGYTTAYLGKWHLGTEDGGSGYSAKPKDLENILLYYGFDHMDPGKDLNKDKGVTDLTSKAITFVEQNKDRPFFIYLSHHAVHTRCAAPQEIVDKYQAKGYPPTGKYPYEGIDTAAYLAMIEHLDNETKRLLDKLHELGLEDDTMVIFMSDNGGATRVTRNEPLRRGKATCYEGGIRVPLIVRWPGQVKSGQVCNVPVHVVDMFPTLLEVAGGYPKKGLMLDGESLVPLFKKSGSLQRDALFWHIPHYICYPKGSFRTTPHGAVRCGDFKLVEFFGDNFAFERDINKDSLIYDPNLARYVPEGKVELFNLRKDIGERRNIASSMPEKVAKLKQQLREWRRSVGAQMPVPNPDYDPNAKFISEFISPKPLKK